METQSAQKKLKPTVIPCKRSRTRLHEGQHANIQSILRSSRIQPKLRLGQSNDKYEQEANRMAEQVMRMPAPKFSSVDGPPLVHGKPHNKTIQRACAACAEDDALIQAKTTGGVTPEVTSAAATGIQALQGGGQPLSQSTRSYFEPRFGQDFSQVRIHSDSKAADAAQAVQARAFTLGHNVIFNRGEYSPASNSGQKLLAHELTHVVQQGQGVAPATIQRQCGDPDFCTPYATTAEADVAEAVLRAAFLPAMSAKFGAEVHDLWESFLSRSPGASLARTVFDTDGDPIEDSFATSANVEDDQEAVLDLVVNRLSRFPGRRLRPHAYTVTSLTNFLSSTEMDNRPINFSNPLSKAGNIAGGIGSSDAGADSRKIARANVALEKVPLIGNSGYIYFELIPFYEVFDAVDLCPGQCGSPAEQVVTIPLSRLEAMGRAYDVPYVVKFKPEPETRREFYSSLPL